MLLSKPSRSADGTILLLPTAARPITFLIFLSFLRRVSRPFGNLLTRATVDCHQPTVASPGLQQPPGPVLERDATSENANVSQQNGRPPNLSAPPGQHLMSAEQWQKVASLVQLSEREQQVCELLFTGLTRAEIAIDLQIKPRTVRQHLENIHTKLNVHNRVGLVLRVMELRDILSSENNQHRAQTSDVQERYSE